MQNRTPRLLSTLLLLSMTFIAAHSENIPRPSVSLPIRVMQFNILQSTNETAGYEWSTARRGPVVTMLKEYAPDVICMQEARKTQCNNLAEDLPLYAQIKFPKDGIEKNGGQRDLIMYRRDKFQCLQWSKFWFSETPDVSSYSWDASTPKLTILAQLRWLEDRKTTFWVYCTHFFPTAPLGKPHCVDMIIQSIRQAVGEDQPVILCGDLNAQPHEALLKPLFDFMTHAATDAPVTDGPRAITYNGFRETNLKVLDHIFTRHIYVANYHVENDQTKYAVRWISDHYPLISDMEIPLPDPSQVSSPQASRPITIYDLQGHCVASGNFTTLDPTQLLPPGTYVEVSDQGSRKIFVK